MIKITGSSGKSNLIDAMKESKRYKIVVLSYAGNAAFADYIATIPNDAYKVNRDIWHIVRELPLKAFENPYDFLIIYSQTSSISEYITDAVEAIEGVGVECFRSFVLVTP